MVLGFVLATGGVSVTLRKIGSVCCETGRRVLCKTALNTP